MSRIWAVLCIISISSLGAVSLSSEAEEILERLMAQGYSGTGFVKLHLTLLEPCTLNLYPPIETSGGFYIGLGGNNTLDLGLSLYGSHWLLEDSMPDDYPVLRVDSISVAEGEYLVICALDMIRGSTSDSAMVLWAFSPVDQAE